MLLLTGGASPAYAVNKNDGTVTVEIDSLRDATGLERKLREAGIRAVVQYLPPGKACKQPWPQTSTLPPDFGAEKAMIKGGVLHTPDGDTRFTISDNLPADVTLVVMTQTGGATDGPEAIGISFARGDVGPCEVVDSTAGDRAVRGSFHRRPAPRRARAVRRGARAGDRQIGRPPEEA